MQQLSTIFEQFEIAIVPFPFVDAPRTKPRPALVLSEKSFNRRNGHTLLAMITTAEHPRWPSDYSIRDLKPTGFAGRLGRALEAFYAPQPGIPPAHRPFGRIGPTRLSSGARRHPR